MSRASDAATCVKGHPAEKLLSSFAIATATAVEWDEGAELQAGGCCGGGACACSAN